MAPDAPELALVCKLLLARHGRDRSTCVIPASGTALLMVDVVNDLAFEGSDALVTQAEAMAAPLAALKRRATAAGVPAIYVNDNFGRWRSDFRRTVTHCTRSASPGHRVSRRLRPTERDYFVLKPKHSGFLESLVAPDGELVARVETCPSAE